MTLPFPTITDFFQPELSPGRPIPNNNSTQRPRPLDPPSGDGFTQDELHARHTLGTYEWTPTNEYAESRIADLRCGPARVSFVARVVNVYEQVTVSKKVRAARGVLKMLVRDDSGVISVWFSLVELIVVIVYVCVCMCVYV